MVIEGSECCDELGEGQVARRCLRDGCLPGLVCVREWRDGFEFQLGVEFLELCKLGSEFLERF